jgi:hypothetical protein
VLQHLSCDFTRRAWLSAAALRGTSPRGDLDFARRIPSTLPRSAAYRQDGFHLWDPAMVRTADGTCHLLYSRWPATLGFDAWATHAEIAWATARDPAGPYAFQRVVLPSRGASHWDGHSVYNTCLLAHGGKLYLYYTGNRGGADWRPERSWTMKDEPWWQQRNRQRIGVAVANQPGGPWQRFDRPLLDTGPDTGQGIIAVPNVIAKPGGGFLLYYKTLAPGAGRFGGGVVHYPAFSKSPLGPFRRCGGMMIDKQKLLRTEQRFDFHIDDHLEWVEDGRYYGIVKDHDAPFLTPHGRSLLLVESDDGISWRLARHALVKDFTLRWQDGAKQTCERLEMPKLHLEQDRPRTLLLAAKAGAEPSFLVAIPLRETEEAA